MSTTTNPLTTVTLAEEHGIKPHRCGRCGNTKQTGLDWQTFSDGDPDTAMYQCCTCGNVTGFTRKYVLDRVRRAAQEQW